MKNTIDGDAVDDMERCTLCPRLCGQNRRARPGRCGARHEMRIALAAPHHWEEPCISGTGGSGTVFFSGCGLGCAFCQNHSISRGGVGQVANPARLAHMFLELQRQGVHNLNLVTATHCLPGVLQALQAARGQGLSLPVVWNSGGYERIETLQRLRGQVDVWLLDLKFHSPRLAAQLAEAPDYFEHAARAVAWACGQAGPPVFDKDGLLVRGVVLRLLVLPGQRRDAQALLHWMADTLPEGGYVLSLMSQYTPPEGLCLPPPFGRRVASYEYDAVVDTAVQLGLTGGYMQDRGSATTAYLPPFWPQRDT